MGKYDELSKFILLNLPKKASQDDDRIFQRWESNNLIDNESSCIFIDMVVYICFKTYGY